MQENNRSEIPAISAERDAAEPDSKSGTDEDLKGVGRIWEAIVRLGLGEVALKVGTAVVSIFLFLLVIWVMGKFYIQAAQPVTSSAAIAAALPTSTPTIVPPEFDLSVVSPYSDGIVRNAVLHTTIPTRPRLEVVKYTVQQGDNLFSIAERFNLKPETLLWGNYDTLADDPHRLQPGQELNILPVDGVYYQWHAGDGVNGVAAFYKVSVDDIINWAGNHLNKDTLGDLAHPNIEPGTYLVIPGGQREFITWSAPRITRSDPSNAKLLGPGYCGTVVDGAVGNGTFIWPTTDHYLSGYDYSPSTNHFGIDIAGSLGNPVYAVDGGVVVYAGWNDWGYGNVVVIDHGNGWQTLYAHLNTLNVGCGSSVFQGTTIGAVGTTGNSSGPHLHFEMLSDQYGKANPWDFLPH